MQHAIHNRATIRVADRMNVDGIAADQVHLDRFHNRIRTACALVAATLTLPALACAQNGNPAITALQAEVTALQTTVTALQNQVNTLQTQLTAAQPVLALAPFVSVDPNPANGVIGPNIKFTGANIHILSGSGATSDNGNPTGLGNLIIGYDDDKKFGVSILGPGDRGGSHNLVIGDHNRFTMAAFGGLVAGNFNAISNSETVCFGNSNSASGLASTVIGDGGNTASATQSVVCGGIGNTAGNTYAVVTGGAQNTANGDASVIIGGEMLTTSNFNQILPQPPFP